MSTRPLSVTIKSKRLDEVQKVGNPPPSPTKISASIIAAKKLPKADVKKTLSKIQTSSSASHITSPPLLSPTGLAAKSLRESNYTPSISSIGSVLRSKTEDFERLLSDKHKKGHEPLKIPSRNAPGKALSDQKMPIYLRQEIISSVQKTVKK